MPDQHAERFRKCIQHLQANAYDKAFADLTELAAENYPPAQYQLALMYANGDGCQLDYVQAATYAGLAAEQQLPPAQSLMGWLYASGLGVKQDDAKAAAWYISAARLGSAKDQYTVATMYRWGRFGLAEDVAKMLHWYQQSAQQGFAPAQHALGQLLAKGELVEQDKPLAYEWLSLAIANGSTPAKTSLQELAGSMDSDAIEQVQQRIRKLAGADDDGGHLL